MRRTKLIATLGPATEAPGVLDALVSAGLDVARLNTAHSSREVLERQLTSVREASARAGREVAVMVDLAGAKLRVGEMTEGTVLAEGSAFELVAEAVTGDSSRASVSYEGLAGDLSVGDRILLDDGAIELAVTALAPGVVTTEVRVGGPLSSRKGVNVPGVHLGVEGITARDLENLEWALSAGADMVSQSFVRCAGDVDRLRAAMGERAVPVVAKIEKHEAVDAINEIVAAADCVMVARGDLGVELPLEEVPIAQRQIVTACRAAGKPVVIATQMLESMIANVRPTRAEASDVANSIFEDVDAVMLSGETAVGLHPALVLSTMDRLVRSAEAAHLEEASEPRARSGRANDIAASVSLAVCELAETLDLAAIVTATQSGATARAVAAHRPRVPVLAVTSDAAVARRLAIVWGVLAVSGGAYETIDDMVAQASAAVLESGLAQRGELIAVTGGTALHQAGTTDFIQVHRV